ncbi:MAG: nitroreductase, partial [Deltaproteobacteria bacterium]
MKGQTSPDRQKIEVVLTNHERTKHHLHRYARSLGYLDWATQPDPFRTYEGAPKIPLSRNLRGWGKPYDALHLPWGEGEPLSLETLGVFFRLALGLSAWKAFGEHRWALRCNPSSGNLHPTEGYALLPTIPGIEGGVYHYVSRDHLLEARCTIPPERRDRWNDLFTPGGFGVGLSSIHWREAWKYGERAYRYCQLDVGHAIGSIGYAAAVLGWRIHLLDTPGDDDIEALLGLEREEDFRRCGEVEREAPDLLLLVTTGRERSPFEARLDEAIDIVRHGRWQGAANALSPDHFFWEQIEVVAQAARKPRTPSLPPPVGEKLPPPQGTSRCNAVELILQRRSAVAMDGRRTIPRERFHAILDRLLPRPRIFPWAALPWQPRIHPVFFVHRVEGLPAGLYLLERDPSVGVPLRRAIRGSVRWE